MRETSLSQYGVRNAGRRIVATWLINAVALALMSRWLDGFNLGSFSDALSISASLGLLNAAIWPLLARFTLPITVLTLGLGSLIINGIFVFLAVQILPKSAGVYIEDWGTGVIVALGVTIINSLFTRLLAIDDDDFYYRNVVKRQAKKQKFSSSDRSSRTGIVFLEIDGLAHEVLQRAIRAGYVPNMARWLREGSHQLMRWECDWSSQTGAMQAGILHGNNWDMPSFRWYEKDKSKAMVSNRPADAAEIERRHSNGKGLLHYDGASRANLVSGDAPNSMLTMSTVLRKKRKGSIGQDYMAFFSNPYNALRTLIMAIGEISREIYQQIAQKRRDIEPRVHRGLFPYPLLRAFTNVLQRELGMSATIQDVYSSRPVIYAMFLGYDEVAHHSGTERPETMRELEKIDRVFGRLERALEDTPRNYQIVVLADHGQTQGATFKQRYGQSLEVLVEDLTLAKTTQTKKSDEGSGYVQAASVEMANKGGMLSVISKLLRSKPEGVDTKEAEVAVLPSGGLGSISFIKEPGRMTLERLNRLYPKLLHKLTNHEGIAFVLVRSQKNGDMAIGKKGTYFLKTGKVSGQNPLEPFGPNAPSHIARTSSFPHCPDIVLNANYWQATGETAAFEELVGSHGAMGGPQQYPFILYPSTFKSPPRPIVGAEKVHTQFRNWLMQLGWDSYNPLRTNR